MQLAVDIGNSRVKCGLFDEDELKEVLISDQEPVYVIKKCFDKHPSINALIISSVRESLDIEMMPIPETIHHVILDSETKIPVENLYKTPHTLGHDRIALAVAANSLFPGRNCLVVDAGTCLTMDIVTDKGEFLGGTISPGIKQRLLSMHHGTAKLPLIDYDGGKVEQIGVSTRTSMESGAVNGMLNEVAGTISALSSQFKNLKVLVTGGDIKIFDSRLKSDIFADPNLVLRGLSKILQHNIKKG